PASQLLVAVGSTTPPRRSTLFPYTTLFRSKVEREFGDADAEVMADSDKVQQVFLNLLHNAVDAMPNGGVLTLQTQRSDTEYVLQVLDTGEGVPAGLNVFEPFVTTKPHGTGLGLAICSEIVREHEGTLIFESAEREGSVFRMRIPLSPRERRRN